jgi:ribosomal protein S18 acetylase RimI-like enzyme
MIEIRPLVHIDAALINSLLGPFTCSDTFRVTWSDSGSSTTFGLELVPLDEPFTNRYDHLDDAYVKEYLSGADLSFGAYEEGVLVGVLVAEKRDWNHSLWVWEFHVDAAHRGQGIGRMLMDHTAEKARAAGLRTMVCETQNQNSNAIKAYRRLGFRLEGIDISYYSNQDYPDRGIAVFMKRRLDG